MTFCSTTGSELLEVWYYGDLLTVKGEPQSYIVDGDEAPGLVAARDPASGEEFVIFDGGRHGYDNMFCEEHDPAELEHRPLKRYEIPASKLVLELGYSIDYEDEKKQHDPENRTTAVIPDDTVDADQRRADALESRSSGTAKVMNTTSRTAASMISGTSATISPFTMWDENSRTENRSRSWTRNWRRDSYSISC